MQTIQVVLDSDLLRQADRAAAARKLNRSALFREALREHLKRLAIKAQEERDRAGYANSTQDPSPWERAAQWPEL